MSPVNYLGYAEAARGLDPFSSLVRGYGAGQTLQQQSARTDLLRAEAEQQKIAMQQARAKQEALKGYAGGGGDIQAAMQIDPATGMALEDRQRKVIGDAIEIFDKEKFSAYGNLEHYNNVLRPQMLKVGVPPAMIPEYKTVEELNKGLTQKESLAAYWKQQGLGPKMSAGGYWKPGMSEPTPWPRKAETPLERARRENLEADLRDPTRKQRPEKPTKLTDYGTFRRDYLKDHPGAPATEVRAAWAKSGTKDKPIKPPKNFAEWKSQPGNENKTMKDYLNYKVGKGGPATPATTFEELPDPAQYKGRTLNNGQLISDGTKWVPNTQ